MNDGSKLLAEMNDRSREVFRRVVESYLNNGDPVGSRTLTRTMNEKVSAATIRDWVHQNGAAGRALLWENQSYVFFRGVSDLPAGQGPLGAMNRSITQGRSIAVDPAFVPLGAPVWMLL